MKTYYYDLRESGSEYPVHKLREVQMYGLLGTFYGPGKGSSKPYYLSKGFNYGDKNSLKVLRERMLMHNITEVRRVYKDTGEYDSYTISDGLKLCERTIKR